MEEILTKIQKEIKEPYYTQNFPNDGQRFVAWYLRNIFLLDQRQAKDAITDGAKDKQIDAVFIDNDNSKIYIIQGKFYTGPTINAEPIREIVSVWNQMKDMEQMQQSANFHLMKKLCEISNVIENDDYSVCYQLVTTSTLTTEAKNDAASFQKILSEDESTKFSADIEVVDLECLGIAYERSMEKDNPCINQEIQLEKGKYLTTDLNSTKVIIAALPLKECIKIQGIKDGTLFQKNVRQSLGISNKVNKEIKKTITGEKSGDFFFFHNGITAICNKIDELGNDVIKLHSMSVVNGCQSLTTILSCSESIKKKNDAYVLFRFYEIPQRDRADSISINTNSQSTVKARDLRSNDKRVLALKKAYENKYTQGFFATKRGDIIPADKDKDYVVELSLLGKCFIAWYSQRPNIAYGESKIFDKYFDILFKHDYSPEDMYALTFFMKKIMKNWTEDNPLGIDEMILTMKAYAPFHFLYGISALVAKCNNNTNVPSPAECLRLTEKSNLTDIVVNIVSNCLNNAYTISLDEANTNGKTFIPQNWIKSKASISAIQAAIGNYVSFLPTMNPDMSKQLKSSLAMDKEFFEYRLSAD
ncbi:MAG: AIPR family protein [Bacteroidales bacterium]|nr:AIPR family protein [Bacteroidales bacterium]